MSALLVESIVPDSAGCVRVQVRAEEERSSRRDPLWKRHWCQLADHLEKIKCTLHMSRMYIVCMFD